MWRHSGLYIRKGLAYVPTEARTEAGFYLEVEPIEVVTASDEAALEKALLDTIRRGHPIVPTPDWRDTTSSVARCAKVKSWSAFQRDALCWGVGLEGGQYVIAPWRKSGRGFEPDREAKEFLPGDTPVEQVVRRLVQRVVAELPK
jgi:hypothetical protein